MRRGRGLVLDMVAVRCSAGPSNACRGMMSPVLNKTMDRGDLEAPAARAVARELDELIDDLRACHLSVSSWYGSFELPGDPDSMERVNRAYDYQPPADAAHNHLLPRFAYWET